MCLAPGRQSFGQKHSDNGSLNFSSYQIEMITAPNPLRFGHHALAALGAAMLGSTIFSLIWSATLAVAAGDRMPGIAWLATLAAICWLGVFIIALPGAGVAFSLLWPITRRMTTAAKCICIGAGATIGIIFAPLSSPKFHGASIYQLCVFALTGAAIAVIYLAIIARFAGSTNSASGNVGQLEPVNS
jgi:hypothetical protein